MKEAGEITVSNSDVTDELPGTQGAAQVPAGVDRTQFPRLLAQCSCQHLPLTTSHPTPDLSNQ